jgi:hypothetical protein
MGGGHFESPDCPLKVEAAFCINDVTTAMFPEFNIELPWGCSGSRFG